MARDRDRLALAERERILKRAQIAQATAVLVHEANWAKNRMESEMRLARERLQAFPDPAQPPPRIEPPKPARSYSLFPSSPITIEAPAQSQPGPTRQSSVTGSMTPAEKPSARSSKEEPIFVESALVSSVTDQVQSSVADAAAGMIDTTNKISGALSSSYTGLMSSFQAVVESIPEIAAVVPEPPVLTPTVVQESNPITTQAIEGPRQVIETKSLLPPPKANTTLAVGEFPGRPEFAKNDQTKVVQPRTKGQWTDPNLHAQAGAVLQQLILERDLTIQKNPLLMERLYGLPNKEGMESSVRTAPVQPEWVAAADAWVEAVTGNSIKKSSKAKSKIDPAIASFTGVDPNLLEQEREGSKVEGSVERSDIQAQPEPEDEGNNSRDAKNKKKCVIM